MKLTYCIHSIYNPGGMERVLLNKVTYLKNKMGWDVSIVTTDQHGRPPFYPFPDGVEITDLGINYSDDNHKSPLLKFLGYFNKRRAHRKALTEFLKKNKTDIMVSLYPSESSFIPKIKDGSRKVLELHYNRFFRLLYGRKGLLRLADLWRTRRDPMMVRRFDKFIVLTNEDAALWGGLPNMEVIPNAAMKLSDKSTDSTPHRVIAVGRLDYQKSFDRLLAIWEKVMRNPALSDWKLDIFGQGEWKQQLEDMIDVLKIRDSVTIHKPVKDIGSEYIRSSILVMTSHYEGFPMVMIEGMACGLPAVSFDFKCGPYDIIRDGNNGYIVTDGDIDTFAERLTKLMTDDVLRKKMSESALEISETFSEEKVMEKWIDLFETLKPTANETVAN